MFYNIFGFTLFDICFGDNTDQLFALEIFNIHFGKKSYAFVNIYINKNVSIVELFFIKFNKYWKNN